MKKLNLLLGIVLALIVVSCGTDKMHEGKTELKAQAMKVKVTTVNKTNNSLEYTYSGLVEPLVNTSLSFQALGTVKKVWVDEGDFVKNNQLLAKLDDVSMQNAYNAALAVQKQAQDAYDRLKTVYEKGSLPEIQWEEMKTNLEKANSAAAMANQNLKNTELRAPYAGVIGSRNIELGSSVNPAIKAFDIVTIDDVYVRISVPENEISKFEKGQIGTVTIPAVGAQNYQAKVEKIGVMANQLSKTYAVKLRIANTDNKIKPGMVCDTKISIDDKSNSLTVPMQAVMNEPHNSPYVFVLNQQSKKVSKRAIKIGSFTNSNVQVLTGLKAGELVVINGQQKLIDNMSVSF